jgi:aryl-alcohol dehydrogenase (NADP+)
MGVIVWSPLNGGWLTGKYQQGASAPEGSRMARFDRGPWRMQSPATERKLEIVDALATLAEDAGVSLIELSIAFTLCHPAVTSAIIGPRTIDQLESQLPAAAVQLGEDVLDAIDALVPPGHTVTVDDISFEPRALRAASRRR